MTDWLNDFWEDYVVVCPDAGKIHSLLHSLGEPVVNDHIALRTFNRTPITRNEISQYFIERGYQQGENYSFPEKSLSATYYIHEDDCMPKVFISELLLEGFSSSFVGIIDKLIRSAQSHIKSQGLSIPTMPWEPIPYSDYITLQTESEYAAWVAAMGIRANHFTVSVNHLKNIPDIPSLNQILKDNDFKLNHRGGEVKGSPQELLVQSSTMAKPISWPFADGNHEIPGCYYEFAQRFPDPDTGKLFEGFIAQSANKIFESTNAES